MTILVLNAGSSSVKYQLFNLPHPTPLAKGNIEHIGPQGEVKNHRDAFAIIQKSLIESGAIASFDAIDAVGHRVVHGGDRYSQAMRIDDEVLDAIRSFSKLAPLHNPANALGIIVAQNLSPSTPNVAVFDTAFHQTMPPENYLYAIPRAIYEAHKIRRYGFHGTSHHYVALQMAQKLGVPLESLNLITLHLGNGASACAIAQGKSIDTSMGFTPLEGLVMGTRSGDIDPAITTFLLDNSTMTHHDIDTLLNKQSGLLGLTGDNDIRTLLGRVDAGDTQAQISMQLYVNRIKKYIGAYMALLGRVDGIVFTGGVGEHAVAVRSAVLEGLAPLGIVLDAHANRQEGESFCITTSKSPIATWVIATNEELFIAQQTAALLES
ncbi:MAG: hypothetical protein KU37_04295 [Sulfuricurvum sp. PC08-66]|nr:MAG: hypothetical protein KU37_04295 [Sulfuricurvum sp. PC08-66]